MKLVRYVKEGACQESAGTGVIGQECFRMMVKLA